MVCDLAETYNIFDYERLPVKRVAVFVCGLRENARVWKKMGYDDIDRKLQILMYDRINWIAWTKTEAAQNGGTPPEPLFSKIYGEKTESPDDTRRFESPEQFQEAWEKIRRQHGDNSGCIRPDNTIS